MQPGEPSNHEEALQLYEKWRANPLIEVRLGEDMKSMSYRSTANTTCKDKFTRVNDHYLAQKMMTEKTYYTELKEQT